MNNSVTRTGLIATACLLALVGCGGGGGSDAPPPVAPAPAPSVPPPPAPPPAPPPVVIGTTGGTISESSGATVNFPADAVTGDTTFRVAMDSTGAPPIPTGITRAGNMYAITPHGGDFKQPVEVSIPVPNVTLLDTQELKLAKAQPNGQWEILAQSKVVDGKLTASVNSFSFFIGVVVTYPVPIAQAVPLFFNVDYRCSPGPSYCTWLDGPSTITYSMVGNGGALPAGCTNATMRLSDGHGTRGVDWVAAHSEPMPLSGITVTRALEPRAATTRYAFIGELTCSSGVVHTWYWETRWRSPPAYPSLGLKDQSWYLDVVEGYPATLSATLVGGGSKGDYSIASPATWADHAVVDWERSDDNGGSWRSIAKSFQHEAAVAPYGNGTQWTVRHSFVATARDQGAIIRIHACYTPPAPTPPPPCVFSDGVHVTVLQQTALPAIVDPPRSVLIRTHETANLSASASGLPAPTLQWQTRPANSTDAWTDVTGATEASYTTPPQALSDNGVQYRVVATNVLGSASSSPVTVSVSDLAVAPTITTQPGSLSVTHGGDAVFAAAALGTEALSYQWRFNGTNIAGANTPILRLTQVTNAHAGNYSLYVSNGAGNVTSSTATLQVTASAPAAVAPSIVTQPVSVVANVGNTATFAVGVDGTGPFTFQWLRNGEWIQGAHSASLTFNSVALPNAGSYSVVISNSAGAVASSTVTLDVRPEVSVISPSITSQPSTVIVPAGGSAMLAVGATGSGPLSYQWSFNGVAIPGATLPVLSLGNVGNPDVGDYTVTVTNSVSSTVSQAAQLILLGAPVITQDPAAATAVQGDTATFSVSANGSGLRYQWMRNGTQIPGATQASHTTPMLVEANTGAVYSVMVYNGAGMVTSQGAVLTVQVIVAPSVLEHPASATIEPGQTAPLCTSMGGTRPIQLELHRWVNQQWAPYLITAFGVGEFDRVCYPTPAMQLADSGAQYRFFGRNAAGEVLTDIATITVTAPPPPGITTTTLVSATVAGGVPGYFSGSPSISADGRLVAFTSYGTDLIPEGTNTGSARGHAYLRDLSTNTTTLINRTFTGGVPTRGVSALQLSSNGRYAVFISDAGDLVENDTNTRSDLFRRDLLTGTTERLSVLANGAELENGISDVGLSVSGDGRLVTFVSPYDPITDGSEGCGYCLYLRDAASSHTRYVAGSPVTSPPAYVSLSDSGNSIAYMDYIGATDTVTINRYDMESHSASTVFSYVQGTFPAGSRAGMSISANGRYIAFALSSVPITGTSIDQVMMIDTDDPAVPILLSTGASGIGDGSSTWPRFSGDGRYVMFVTRAPNLTAGLGNSNRMYSVVRDLLTGTVNIASRSSNGTPVALGTNEFGTHAISRDGSVVAFVTDQVYAAPRP